MTVETVNRGRIPAGTLETLEAERAALREVNRLRECYEIGPPLDRIPTGRPRSMGCCPVANALSRESVRASVTEDHIWILDDELETSPEIRRFVQMVDAGRMPHLEDL